MWSEKPEVSDVKTRVDEDEQELQALVGLEDTSGCAIVGCGYKRIDERGPVQMRDQRGYTSSYRVCVDHFEMIFIVLGQSVDDYEDEEDDDDEVLFGEEMLVEAVRMMDYDEEEELVDPIFD